MSRKEEIEFCFEVHGTDKLSHGYAMIYEKVSRYIRNMFEIGIGGGHSLAAWVDLFPFAKIWALDIDTGKTFDHRMVTVLHGDIKTFVPHESLPKFDLIVDDGSHNCEDMIAGWNALHHLCNGLYVIEDVDDSIIQNLQNALKNSSKVNSIIQTSDDGGSRVMVASFDKVMQW